MRCAASKAVTGGEGGSRRRYLGLKAHQMMAADRPEPGAAFARMDIDAVKH